MPNLPDFAHIPAGFLDAFAEMCERMGIDPETFFDQALPAGPPAAGPRRGIPKKRKP
jgi:hypothetical protein